MVPLRSLRCALGLLSLSLAGALAQSVVPPPLTRPTPIAPPLTSTVPGITDTRAPAPIEPPLVDAPGVPPLISPVPGSAGSPGIIDPTLATLPADAAPLPSTLPGAARSSEFQGDDVSLVLRTLARQAGLSIVVSEKVLGTVTLRLENKTPRQAIEVIVNSKGLVLDEKDGVFYVKTMEERAKEPTESASYTLAYGTAEKILPLLQGQLQSAVPPQFDQRTNTLFYRETRSNMAAIALFLETIDKPTQQVMIEARLVEVTSNPQQNYGINWGGVVGGQTPQTFRYGGSTLGTSTIQSIPGTPATPTSPAGLPMSNIVPATLPSVVTNATSGTLAPQDFLFGGAGSGSFLDLLGGQFSILSVPQLSLTLRMLNEDADAEFIANPRVVTANNQKAEIKITRAQPVPQLNFNEQTAQAVFSGFQDKEFGNTLVVTPVINKDGFVSLAVKPEISNKVGDASFTFGGATVTSPIIDKRSLESNVLIKSGDTLAIGGLLQDESSAQRAKVPIVGDIPILGYFFQERRNARVKRNLLVFVTPTVIAQGYGTGLESQVSGLTHNGEEFADPNGWRNNARGAVRLVPTSQRQQAADYPKPGMAPAPKRVVRRTTVSSRK